MTEPKDPIERVDAVAQVIDPSGFPEPYVAETYPMRAAARGKARLVLAALRAHDKAKLDALGEAYDAAPGVAEALEGVAFGASLIDLIGELGRETWNLLDNSEESGPVGEPVLTVDKDCFDRVSAVLDKTDALPFEEPGHILGTGAKLQAALKQTFVAEITALRASNEALMRERTNIIATHRENKAVADKAKAELRAERDALRAERDDLLARNHHGRRALAFADREAEKNETAMLAEIDRLTAERDALAARLAVPGEELAWEDGTTEEFRVFSARTPIGVFSYGTDRDGKAWCCGNWGMTDHDTEDAAKAAALASYRETACLKAEELGLFPALRARVAGLEGAAGKAYALLWRSMIDDPAAKHARGRLLAALTAEEQRAAIAWVISEFGEMSTSELIAADMHAGVFPRRSYDPAALTPSAQEARDAE